MSGDRLSAKAGALAADNRYCVSAGPRGPVLMQGYRRIEKLAQQNRERIPERPVPAKGCGARGALTIASAAPIGKRLRLDCDPSGAIGIFARVVICSGAAIACGLGNSAMRHCGPVRCGLI